MLTICTTCLMAVRLLGKSPEDVAEMFPNQELKCSCGTAFEFLFENEVEARVFPKLRIVDLTLEEFFLYLEGMGLPEERLCSEEEVQKVFSTKKIKKVAVHTILNTTKSHIDHFVFEDGTKLYLGSSKHGAVVYRIAPPPNYVERVDG